MGITQQRSVAPVRLDKASYRQIAVESLTAQSEALVTLADNLGDEFDNAIDLVLACKGRVVICGMGKSGLVGKKITATLASTGTPSFFMHPAEAFHGDLGMITRDDLVVLISNSGETEEILKLLPSLHHFGNPIISMVGKPESTQAKHSNVVLHIDVEREVCPNNLAPTTSTLATMAMGDALAVALIKARDFQPLDFARFHPGGSLGRQLLTTVRDAMSTKLPTVRPNASVHECLFTMTSGRLGIALVMEDKQLKGIVTDGDLRRAMLKDNNLMKKPTSSIMTINPITIKGDMKLADAEKLMHENKIRVLVVSSDRTNDSSVIGILEIFD